MATVYLAHDLRHTRRVAIKVLRPGALALGPERFLAEIKVTASLQHPHVLPVFDSGEADGQLYYAMPFVEGESLRVRLDAGEAAPRRGRRPFAREWPTPSTTPTPTASCTATSNPRTSSCLTGMHS